MRGAGANRAQWLERLSYCGNEQVAGMALTALVVARVMAAVEAGSSGESGDSGLRWEGECELI